MSLKDCMFVAQLFWELQSPLHAAAVQRFCQMCQNASCIQQAYMASVPNDSPTGMALHHGPKSLCNKLLP